MGKWALFTLPLVVVLREGLEAVVFVGGVSLGQSASSIPIAAIVGIICGLLCGFVIYEFASRAGKYWWVMIQNKTVLTTWHRAALTIFLVVMTNFILIIGAGLFSKSVRSFEKNAFNHLSVVFPGLLPHRSLTHHTVSVEIPITLETVLVHSMYEATSGISTAATPIIN
jgi:high-affinity Fe2+/Pb2+ permease